MDPEPLSGADRTLVGLLGWMADTRYSRIRVYSLGTPWKSDILDIAERHLQKGHYADGDGPLPGSHGVLPRCASAWSARAGLRDGARPATNMVKNLPEWREKLANGVAGRGVRRLKHRTTTA